MAKVEAKVAELYELRALLAGLSKTTPGVAGEPPVQTVLVTGLLNENGVTEGFKRGVYKAIRILSDELAPVDKQRKTIQESVDYNQDEKESKDKEVLDSAVEFEVELLDFSKIENLSFSMNYNTLYEKLFK